MVQGGYNVALAAGDSVERHFMDTIEGGKWLADQDLAWTLVTKAVERVHELENELGCFFDRNPDGTVHQKAFAGQTFDRTVHKGDLTGIEIINRLAEQVWARGIERLEEHRAVELVKTADGGALAGVLMIDMRTGEFVFVQAKAVLLATGGGPTMYRYHTPSGDKSCDGLAMALRAGLPLRDMEMVQFHPTGLLAGADTRMTGTVLEEGLRGAGGYLLERRRRALHGALRPARRARDARHRLARDLSPRCAPAARRRTAASTSRWRHLGADNVRRQFKGMVERCADCGFDLAGGLVEVVPTAHYMMGGVEFAADCTHRAARACSPRARTRAACTAPIASAATASPTRRCSAASPATRWRRGSRAKARWREPDARRDRRPRIARARSAVRGAARRPRGDPRSAATTCMWDDVGILRDRRRPRARARRRSPSSTRELARDRRRRRAIAPST